MSSSPITNLRKQVERHRLGMRKRRTEPPPLPNSGQRPAPPSWRFLRPKDLSALKNMLFAAQFIVDGYYAGRHKSPFRGSTPEFIDYREYYPGDELRSIDWKVFARTDRHFVKLFEKETDMACSIFLDVSGSMAYGGADSRGVLPDADISKLEYGCFLTAALSYLMIKQGDKVGLTLFDEAVRKHFPHGGTVSHLYAILRELETCRPGGTTSLSEALRKSHGLLKQRGLLIVVSDMLDDPDAIFSALDLYRHRGFEILLFHVLHEYEIELPPLAAANFIDAEDGAQMTCLPADLREGYGQLIKEFVDKLAGLAKARGVDYNFVHTGTPYNTVIQKYLIRRGRR